MDLRSRRNWFLYAALAVALVVLGAYLGRRSGAPAPHPSAPHDVGGPVTRTTRGFSLAKAEGGRTLFTIHAAEAVEYRQGEPARLHDVNIVIYGKNGDRYDQISGGEFEYDPETGAVRARGPVLIDLESNPGAAAGGAPAPPREQKNLIHVRTSDLDFNQKTGVSQTLRPLTFRLPQATGSAVGARWQATSGVLVLGSQVVISTTAANPATLTGSHAVFTRTSHQVVVDQAQLTQPGRQMTADHMTAFLDDQNQIERILASGNVRSTEQASTATAGPGHPGARADEHYEAHAPTAEFFFAPRAGAASGGKSKLRRIVMTDVVFVSSGARAARATARSAEALFDAAQRVEKIHASGDVHVLQPAAATPSGGGQSLELISDALDLYAGGGAHPALEHAVTGGAARIEIQPLPTRTQPAPEKTVVTAAQFHAQFQPGGRIKSLTGEPQAKIVSPGAPGQPARVSTSNWVEATFDAQGAVSALVQRGDVHYHDGLRQAFGEQARYTPSTQMLLLTGAPRVLSSDGNTTAETIRVNRATGEAWAEGAVKSTYVSGKPGAGGGLLGSSDPVHVTADHMQALRSPGAAHYSGHARLWQDANLVQAPVIDFDRNARSMQAKAESGQLVESLLIENGAGGKQTPVNVTARQLVYRDAQRLASYDGAVVMRGAEGALTADHVDIYLQLRAQPGAGNPSSAPSQIDRAIASGSVTLTQPGRTAVGEKLVYTDSDQKFVLTGSAGKQPQVTDAQRGLTRGDRLTFFRGQDRIMVEAAGGERAYTVTSVK